MKYNLAILPILALALFSGCKGNTPVAETATTIPALLTSYQPASEKAAKIQWLTIEQAAARMEKEPRKIVIDVYTDWCGWCRKMDKETFTDPKVVELVNKHYYAVKLNAEGKDPITLRGQTFKYKGEYRSHELAVALLQGQMSFPTTVYLDEKMNMLAPVPGYLNAKTFSKILSYFGENHHQSMNFQEYEKKN
ncbi:thioredoxin family protein [Pontibacter chinhatensis]|uniref:Thioredoxin-related protein n=1 Tax=Pontibacter chinhatensis TaxID=1436961 RepID=A0A1I2N2D7_9BACT|nr:thioredoxin fold domain-containing protein [Pontibacter chinhatensis]SFF97558.1 Thioredoxin-related protein [Pontibacter chinhatensis]